jgi:drug/metabolite transporter (DMT)-like permease
MENLRGIVLMVASMAGFAVEDMFIKWAAADVPTGQILLLLSIFGTSFFAVMARRQNAHIWNKQVVHSAVLWRNAGEMLGTAGFVTALALTPLTSATAIFQATPLAVTLGAALFLGESVGWRRWTAILVGFCGVILIIRPGMDGFNINSLWSIVAVIGLSARDVATRRIPQSISTMQLAAWGFIAVGILGAGMLAASGGAIWLSGAQAGYIGGALLFGIGAYWAITQASRLGEISVITPFRYVRLIFALIIGALVFAERPDVITLSGAALIIGSGLYTFARERMRKRTLSMTVPSR